MHGRHFLSLALRQVDLRMQDGFGYIPQSYTNLLIIPQQPYPTTETLSLRPRPMRFEVVVQNLFFTQNMAGGA